MVRFETAWKRGRLSFEVSQAAEKGLDIIRTPEKYPSGPKGLLILLHLRHD
jgi:hypothetical protein